MNYKNQKVVKIAPLGALKYIKPEKGELQPQFLIALNWDELLDVMSDLDAPTFMLWEYILKWRGKEEGYYFSPADLEINFGWSENSSRKYFKNLIIKNYLIETAKNKYTFIPYPEEVTNRAAKIRENNRKKREERMNKKDDF